jgi:uncharacterized protein YjbI with pentapeptide repeats
MANLQHFDLLKKGVEIWNQWRDEHPDGLPDFRDADLSGTMLNGGNLSEADLSGANLSFAILSGANLISANFRGANL